VIGARHHFWHLDPAAPFETLRIHEKAGLLYDSSLAFEFYPGFRRGVCHPFHVFDPIERRELNSLELAPAWMDDHFSRRLEQNRIPDPEDYARQLIEVARITNGIILVDYHVRGMNQDFFPQYGKWLMEFVEKYVNNSFTFVTPSGLAQDYLRYENTLKSHSLDLAD
jgi:hypothetical protein